MSTGSHKVTVLVGLAPPYHFFSMASLGEAPCHFLHLFTHQSCRWFVNHAATIQSVHLTATLSPDEEEEDEDEEDEEEEDEGEEKEAIATWKFLETQLPLLVGWLSNNINVLDLTFYGMPLSRTRP
jgi:hypothetical protein